MATVLAVTSLCHIGQKLPSGCPPARGSSSATPGGGVQRRGRSTGAALPDGSQNEATENWKIALAGWTVDAQAFSALCGGLASHQLLHSLDRAKRADAGKSLWPCGFPVHPAANGECTQAL